MQEFVGSCSSHWGSGSSIERSKSKLDSEVGWRDQCKKKTGKYAEKQQPHQQQQQQQQQCG